MQLTRSTGVSHSEVIHNFFSDQVLLGAYEIQRHRASHKETFSSWALEPERRCDVVRRKLEAMSVDLPWIYGLYDSHRRKHRQIEAPKPDEAIIERAIWQQVNGYFEKLYIPTSFCGITDKGARNAIHYVWNLYTKLPKDTWFLKGDIKQYYASMDHEILHKKLSPHLPPTLVDVCMLFTYPKIHREGLGIGIGHLLSQLYGNLFLNDFDHWFITTFPQYPYVRYADDFIILNLPSSDETRRVREIISDRLKTHEHLILSELNINRLAQGLDFVGGVMHPFKGLRVRDVVVAEVLRAIKKGKLTSLISYLALASGTASYEYLKSKIPPSMRIYLPRGF